MRLFIKLCGIIALLLLGFITAIGSTPPKNNPWARRQPPVYTPPQQGSVYYPPPQISRNRFPAPVNKSVYYPPPQISRNRFPAPMNKTEIHSAIEQGGTVGDPCECGWDYRLKRCDRCLPPRARGHIPSYDPRILIPRH